MRVAIGGCRGSTPSPSYTDFDGTEFSTAEFGGNTTSYLVQTESGKNIIIDAGTGIRNIGRYMLSNGFGQDGNDQAMLLLTHGHWDHIHGFPFFAPAYVPTAKIDLFGQADLDCLIDAEIESVPRTRMDAMVSQAGEYTEGLFRYQQHERTFPVQLDQMPGIANYFDFAAGGKLYGDGDVTIESCKVNHPGGSLAYRITENGKSAVIVPDFEPDGAANDENLIAFWEGADLVIADAQYEPGSERNDFKKGWGHSDLYTDVRFALQAGVKQLVGTHHDPTSDDEYLRGLETKAQVFAGHCVETAKEAKLEGVSWAREGSVYEV